MELKLTTLTSLPTKGCLVLTVFSGKSLSRSASEWDRALQGSLQLALESQAFTGELETSLYLPVLPGHPSLSVLLVGSGNREELKSSSLKKIMNQVAQQLKTNQISDAYWVLSDLCSATLPDQQILQSAIMALSQLFYQFTAFKSKAGKNPNLNTVQFVFDELTPGLSSQLQQSLAVQQGMKLCKDLGNTPSNICTPTYLAEQAKSLATQYSSLKTTILEEQDLKDLGMNAFLAVSKGSEEPAKFILIEYRSDTKSESAPHIIVGKGITFDSGGISIKPSEKMDEMKYDMCGAASVIGTMKAIAEMKLPLHVIGAIAASENLPSGHATKPGDIVTSLSGQTIEILNTDAEGRLVLCDVLTYVERFKPASVIDVATLTAAMIIALGAHITGMMSNHEGIVDKLIEAGRKADDLVWYLPINEDYEKALESPIADMSNISNWDRSAGSITAACFLSKFTKAYPWAHLDIAGTAWVSGKNRCATGRPVPLLVQYLVDRSHDAR